MTAQAASAPAERQEEGSLGWYQVPVDRKVLKKFYQRTDRHALVHLLTWFALLRVTGYIGYLTWGTWWAVPAFLAYGTLYSGSEARAHELGHGTPFKTPWLNKFFYQITAFMSLREAQFCKWRHATHHTHTIDTDHDPEIQVKRPADLLRIAADFFFLVGGWAEIKELALHTLGIKSEGAKAFVPEQEWPKVVWSSRVYVALIALVAAFSVYIGSFLPMMYVALPRFYGGWFMQMLGLTQHAGLAEDATDHRLNTRTLYLDPFSQFLYFNMNYHLEHHLFPMVPFHALPALHREIKDKLPPAYSGLREVYAELAPALWRQSRDPGYYVSREHLIAPAPA